MVRSERFRGTIGLESPHYKWIALSNTTLGMLMASLNTSIVLDRFTVDL